MNNQQMAELEQYMDEQAVGGTELFDGILPHQISFEGAMAKVNILVWRKKNGPLRLRKLYQPGLRPEEKSMMRGLLASCQLSRENGNADLLRESAEDD